MIPDTDNPRFRYTNIFLAAAALLVLTLFVSLINNLAYAATTQVQVASIIGHKFSYGETIDDVHMGIEVIKDVDPATCHAEAQNLQASYQAQETIYVGESGPDFTPRSYAFCSVFTEEVDVGDGGTITVRDTCEVLYDPNSTLTAREQLVAACLQQ